jgi:hypothetical protein
MRHNDDRFGHFAGLHGSQKTGQGHLRGLALAAKTTMQEVDDREAAGRVERITGGQGNKSTALRIRAARRGIVDMIQGRGKRRGIWVDPIIGRSGLPIVSRLGQGVSLLFVEISIFMDWLPVAASARAGERVGINIIFYSAG